MQQIARAPMLCLVDGNEAGRGRGRRPRPLGARDKVSKTASPYEIFELTTAMPRSNF